MNRERPRTPDQCEAYHEEMASFHMACKNCIRFDLRDITKYYGHHEQDILELKKFLILKSTLKDIGREPKISPSEKIEEMWGDFLKLPVLYHTYCSDLVELQYSGRRKDNGDLEISQYSVIDHVPLSDPIHTSATFNNTLREYSRFFLYEANGEVWRNPHHVVVSPELLSYPYQPQSISTKEFVPDSHQNNESNNENVIFASDTAKDQSDRSTTGFSNDDDNEMRNSEKHHNESNESHSKKNYKGKLYTLTSTGRKGFLNEEYEKTISERYPPHKEYTPHERTKGTRAKNKDLSCSSKDNLTPHEQAVASALREKSATAAQSRQEQNMSSQTPVNPYNLFATFAAKQPKIDDGKKDESGSISKSDTQLKSLELQNGKRTRSGSISKSDTQLKSLELQNVKRIRSGSVSKNDIQVELQNVKRIRSDSFSQPRGRPPSTKNGKMIWDTFSGYWIDEKSGEKKHIKK